MIGRGDRRILGELERQPGTLLPQFILPEAGKREEAVEFDGGAGSQVDVERVGRLRDGAGGRGGEETADSAPEGGEAAGKPTRRPGRAVERGG
jgi:hypothetical protein